jgi:hypothetical protein
MYLTRSIDKYLGEFFLRGISYYLERDDSDAAQNQSNIGHHDLSQPFPIDLSVVSVEFVSRVLHRHAGSPLGRRCVLVWRPLWPVQSLGGVRRNLLTALINYANAGFLEFMPAARS